MRSPGDYTAEELAMFDEPKEQIETQIMRLEDDIQMDLAQFPSWIRFLLYWYFRLTEPEERDELDKLFNK